LEAVDSTKKKPIFLTVGLRVARKRADDGKLVRWKNALTKGIFAITMLGSTTFFYYETDKKTKAISTKHWSKMVALFDQTLSSCFHRKMMWDLALSGRWCSSFLIVKSHM
jgi:hypothetical protein